MEKENFSILNNFIFLFCFNFLSISLSYFPLRKIKISQFISQLDSYPPSLNKTLILGALEYVFLAQRKLDKIGKKDEECLEIVKLIREDLDIVQSKLKSKSEEFYLVSIDDAEEVFEKIENICSQKGILPKIEDENVDLSEFINGQSISTSI